MLLSFNDHVHYITVQQNALINMTNNTYSRIYEMIPYHYVYVAHSISQFTAPCYYQYTAEGQNFDKITKKMNFTIVFHNDISIHTLMTTHCRWLPGSAFNNTKPLDINNRLIKSDLPLAGYHKLICYCYNDTQDCSIDTLATVYPGQTISLSLVLNYLYTHILIDADFTYTHVLTVEINDDVLPPTACKVAKCRK